jgi:hypothetical protein
MQILDHLLGHNDSALFRRAQLKALVSIHGREVGSDTLNVQRWLLFERPRFEVTVTFSLGLVFGVRL